MPRTVPYQVFIVLASLFAGCQSDDDSAMADGGTAPDASECQSSWTKERADVVQGLAGTYRGSITDFGGDSGGDTVCEHAGEKFELKLQLAGGASCAEAAVCGSKAFRCELNGSLKLGEVASAVDGVVYDVSGTSAGLYFEITTDGGGRARLEGVEHARKLGGVGDLVVLGFPDAADGDAGGAAEVCALKIEDVP